MLTEQHVGEREKLLQDYYDACDVQDWDAIGSFLSPNVEFRVGNNPATHSFEALKTRVVSAMKDTDVTEMIHTVGPCIHDASGRNTVAEITVRMKRSNGRAFEGPCVGIFRFTDDGLIDRYHAYLDEGDFWL